MNTSGEAADQVMRMMLEGTEVLIKLSGKGAERAFALAYTTFRQQKKTQGAIKLSNMLRSGTPVKVFTFHDRVAQATISSCLSCLLTVSFAFALSPSVYSEHENQSGNISCPLIPR